MVADKDIDVVLSLLPQDAVYYFTQPATSRALSAKELQKKWLSIHPQNAESLCFESCVMALHTAQKDASNEDIIFIGGSNYLVGEVLELFHKDSWMTN